MSKVVASFKHVWHKLHKKGARFDREKAERLIGEGLNHDMQQSYGKELRKATIVEEVSVQDHHLPQFRKLTLVLAIPRMLASTSSTVTFTSTQRMRNLR